MKKNNFFIASILCYCFSLVLPIMLDEDDVGFNFLLTGWVSVFNPYGIIYSLGLPWLANFIYFINLSFSRIFNIWIQVLLSITTLLFSIPFFFLIDSDGFFLNKMNLGSWFWVLSFLTLLVGQVQNFKSKNLITKYNSDWKRDFEIIKKLHLEELHSIKVNIEHVGSTAVESMPAKPIIDIDISYNEDSEFAGIRTGLGNLGYYHNGDQGIEGREVFKRSKNQKHEILDSIAHHLYVCHYENEELKRHILFRDHLRKNEKARNQYAQLKIELAKKANQDKKEYAKLKEKEATSFISDCIKKQEIENEK